MRLSQLRKLRDCEQVAAVCYRVRGCDIEFLLVRTRESGRWTFPKGSAEPGLTHAQAAALEAYEEAGVHGRIEEAPFARYVRRRGYAGGAGSSGRKLEVSAHLCEVRRLSPAPERRRDRTWFVGEDAIRHLRQGRKGDDGAEFARVIDSAVERIRHLHPRSGVTAVRPALDPIKTDALQKVKFDFAEAYGDRTSFAPYVHRQLNEMRQSAVPETGSHRREVLPCEVLDFGSARSLTGGKKPKALGIGTRSI